MFGSNQIQELGGGGAFLWGAHHPHCERHRHHLLWLRGRPLCLGCTSSALGLGLSIPWAFVAPQLALLPWIGLHLTLLLPTAMQPFVQRKPFKLVARILLGVAVGSYWLTGPATLGAWVNMPLAFISMLLAFALGYVALSRVRERWTADPCRTCPLGRYPTCDWNLPRLLASAPDQRLATAIRSRMLDARAADAP